MKPESIAPLWSVQEVSNFLQVPVQTSTLGGSRGGGPPARRVGKHLRYRPEDVIRWVDQLDSGAA
jgi:hypothetical protein